LEKELGARIKPEEIEAGSRKKIRLRESELVKIYMKLYKPKEMLLVARCAAPKEVKRELENAGVEVIDDVQFNEGKLKEVSEKLLEHALPVEDVLILKGELARMIRRKSMILGKPPEKLIKEAIDML